MGRLSAVVLLLACLFSSIEQCAGFLSSNLQLGRILRKSLFVEKTNMGGNNAYIPKVALTREVGKNVELWRLLQDFDCMEIPSIEFQILPDASKLAEEIPKHEVILITSPQAAMVFQTIWESIGKPFVKVASVGKGTSKVLAEIGIKIYFEPSKFCATSLADELPVNFGTKLLYPCSKIAENTLQDRLKRRGFTITRVNTYHTQPRQWTEEQYRKAKAADIVTFASPSAVNIWYERCGNLQTAVAIGPSCAEALRIKGFKDVYSPEDSLGIEKWADQVRVAAKDRFNYIRMTS